MSIEVAQRMTGFGETLRKEREARGVALETITKVTKISNRHLVALEREQFQSLPGGVFNKGIVRGYARVVGLNEQEWVDRYLSAYQSSGAAPNDESDWVQFAENASKGREGARSRRPDKRLRWTGVVVLLLVLAGLSWFVWGYIHRKVVANAHPALVHSLFLRSHPPGGIRVRPPASALIPSKRLQAE